MTKSRKGISGPSNRMKMDARGTSKSNPIVIEHVSDDDNSSRMPHISTSVAMVPFYATPSSSGAATERRSTLGSEEAPILVDDSEDDSMRAIRGERNALSLTPSSKKQGTSTLASPNRKKQGTSGGSIISKASQNSKSTGASSRSSASSKRSGSRKKPVNLTSICADNDPVLEKELEDIAIYSRSGMIGGTPSKAVSDIENGKSQPPPTPPVANHFVEDAADKSGHTFLTVSSETKTPRNKKVALFLVLAALLVLIVGILSAVLKKDKSDPLYPSDDQALTDRQQVIHGILTQVTRPGVLADPTTPQYQARRWILFRDTDLDEISEERVAQRYALACFFFATGGDTWKENNWLDGHECEANNIWDGISCSPEGDVRAIVFDNGGLTGTIPPEVGHFSNLENLILKNNPDLVGWVPTEIGHLKSLEQIGLYNNGLTGTIPSIFEHTHHLKFINLEGNDLRGSIPLGVSNLKNLETLALANNKLEGIVPIDQLAKTNIKYLGLSHNRFSSIIERSIKDVETLEHIYLDNNEMRGRIPENIGYLTHLKSFDIGNNKFTGSVPADLGNLRNLEYLAMNDNQFIGELPKQLGRLTNMRTLNVASNQLSGTMPNISNMVHLINLLLFDNRLSGTIPEAVQQLESIQVIFMSSNKFTGEIPAGVKRLKRTLKGLYLSDNQLEGTISPDLCEFAALEALFLDTNKLTGPIPDCFGDLVELRQLYLFQNQLTGTVPQSFQELRHLTGLGLEQNDIVGEIPDEVCDLVDNFSLDIWADCIDEFGSEPLLCSCCSVCCPGPLCA